jgi:heme exporter protein B
MAVFQKEWKSESRSLSGITTTALLCFVSVVIANTITWTTSINAVLGAGIYWMILVFTASVSLPRIFLQEEDDRTADFWRLNARPEAVYWGKSIFNIIQMLIATTLMTIAFVIMVKVKVENPLLLFISSFGGAVSIGSTVTLAGAIAAGGSNRYALAAALSVPLFLFLINLGVTTTAVAFGENFPDKEKWAIIMIAYSVAASTIGPVVYSKIWKG